MGAVDTTFTRRRIVRNELVAPLRGRRAQPVPDQAVLPLGPRVPGLDDRKHADDRLHLPRGVALGPVRENVLAAQLLVGGVIWAFLGIIFEIVTETVAWERWEGTIEYTFMAPISRSVHLIGMGVYAVIYGLIRAAAIFVVVVAFIAHPRTATRTTAPPLLCWRSPRCRSSASG